MTHMHWVPRQNKLEIPNDEEEVNTREIHKCDGQTHDPDTMVVPLTPKPTRKAEILAKASSIIASRREEDTVLKKWPKPRLCCANGILETKANDGSTAAKAPAPRTNPNTKEAPTAPKPHTHPSHERDEQAATLAMLLSFFFRLFWNFVFLFFLPPRDDSGVCETARWRGDRNSPT